MFTFSAFVALIPLLVVLASRSHHCQQSNPSFHESPAVEAVQCRNDYSTHIHCSWTQASQTPLHLFHSAVFRNRSTESPCVHIAPPCQDAAGNVRVHCRYNTSMFVIHARDFFFFKVPHVKVISKTLDLHSQARPSAVSTVGVGPPLNLSVMATEEGDWMLTWQSPLTSEPSPSLTYQLGYRCTNQEWTELEVQGTEVRLQASVLVPDSEHEARVRVKGTQGLWSEWSALVHWRPDEAFLPGPSNLDCMLHGEKEVLCSWELCRDLAQYVTYNLSYRMDPTAPPQQCRPDPPRPPNLTDPALRFGCAFPVAVPRPHTLRVQLQAVPISRQIKSHKHIQPPRPTGVQVETRGKAWMLSWTLPNLRTVPVATEVYYWSTDAPENSKSFSLEAGIEFHSIPAATLQPSTRYSAQVRALVDSSWSSHYSGYPSLWSEPVHWTTRSVLWSAFMISYVTMAACVFVTVLLLYICQRRFRQWEVSIPTPVNSKVLEDISKGNQTFQVKGKMSPTETDNPHIDQAHILERTHTLGLLLDLSTNAQTGCILAVKDDDLYQQVPCQRLNTNKTVAMLTQGSSASQMSELSFDDLYMTCPTSGSSTGVVVKDEDISEVVVTPSSSSSPDSSVHN